MGSFIKQIPVHFPNTLLEMFIVMPNHIHLIITIDNPETKKQTSKQLYAGIHPQMSAITPRAGSLPVIIGSFKSICKKMIIKKHPKTKFEWQTRYYDHIIRKRESMHTISQYLLNNPIKWELDRNNPQNIY
ncbi:hypothetical protein HY932_01455 [Candidatus Falkowbacteria bacterium]|nr:hypothetical protein [Candidatus Falkowbacteria bacterium]